MVKISFICQSLTDEMGGVGRKGYLSVKRRVQGNHFISTRTMALMMGNILFIGLIFIIKLLVCMRKILSIS